MGSYAGLLEQIKDRGYRLFRARLTRMRIDDEVSMKDDFTYEGFYVKPPELKERFSFFTHLEEQARVLRVLTGTLVGITVVNEEEIIMETGEALYRLIDEGEVV